MSTRRERTRPPTGDGYFARSDPNRSTNSVIFAWLCGAVVFAGLLALAIGLLTTVHFTPKPITPAPTPTPMPTAEPPQCLGFLDLLAEEQPRTRDCGEPSTDGVLGECGEHGHCYAYAPDVIGADATTFDPVAARIECDAPDQCTAPGEPCACAISTCERISLGPTPELQTFQCLPDPPTHYCEAFDTLPIDYQQFVRGCAPPAPGVCRCDEGVCEARYYRAGQAHTEEPAADTCSVSSEMCGGAEDELQPCVCHDIKVCQRLVEGEPAFFECQPPRFDPADDFLLPEGSCARKTCLFGDSVATGCVGGLELPNQLGGSCDGAGNCVPQSFITTGACASAECVGAPQGTECTTCDCACTRRNNAQIEEPFAVGDCFDGPRVPTPAPTPSPTPPPTPVPTAECGACPIDPGNFDMLVENCGPKAGTCVVSLVTFCDLGNIGGESFSCVPAPGQCASDGQPCTCISDCSCLARTTSFQFPSVLACE